MPFVSRWGSLFHFGVSCFIPSPTKYWLLELSCMKSFHMYKVFLGDHQLFFLDPVSLPFSFCHPWWWRICFLFFFSQFYFTKTGLARTDLILWLSVIITPSHSAPGLPIQRSILYCNKLCFSREFQGVDGGEGVCVPHPRCLPSGSLGSDKLSSHGNIIIIIVSSVWLVPDRPSTGIDSLWKKCKNRSEGGCGRLRSFDVPPWKQGVSINQKAWGVGGGVEK